MNLNEAAGEKGFFEIYTYTFKLNTNPVLIVLQ